MTYRAIRGSILHFPRVTNAPDKDFQYIEDGLLVTRNGKVIDIGSYKDIFANHTEALHIDYSGKLISAGFIDSHLHFPQTEMIASFGEQLLEWLEKYTFPTEEKFKDHSYCEKMANVFIQQLLRNGTTTAMVYGSVHKQSADALFAESQRRNMLMIAGKVSMDRNCPQALRDTPQQSQRDNADLIDKWHGKNRQYYALTPRFAPTSTPEQMSALSELAQQYPDVFIQTHLSENQHEIDWVKALYPQFSSYLDVYHHYNLVRPRAVFGHCIHMQPSEWERMAETGATIAFCPTSNLFLGSGLFQYSEAMERGIHVNLATDVGAGTSFNMLKTLGEAYKVCQLNHTKLHALEGLYHMTLGAAASLKLDDKIGNLNPGTDADFVVIDPCFDDLTTLRLKDSSSSPEDLIFALSMLGDDRAIKETWILGELAYNKFQGT